MARFGQALKPSKPPQQLSKASEPHNPPQQLSAMVPPYRPHNLFLLASKLLRGTFWAGLKTLKTSAAAFEGLRTSQPSAAAFTGVPLALPWYLPRPHKLFLLGFETATWHVLGRPSNPQNLRTLRSSFRPWYLPSPTSCFYLARFGQALKPSKPPQQLSKASEPHNPPQQLSVMVPP